MAKSSHDERYQGLIAQLVAARKSLGLTQTELARRLEARQQFVSRYEVGERHLDVVELVDVAEALGLDPVALVRKLVAK